LRVDNLGALSERVALVIRGFFKIRFSVLWFSLDASSCSNQIRRLPVLNRDKLLVGIVSLGDLATRADEKRAGETLEKVSEPSRQERAGIGFAAARASNSPSGNTITLSAEPLPA
jgi:hypothetical protein